MGSFIKPKQGTTLETMGRINLEGLGFLKGLSAVVVTMVEYQEGCACVVQEPSKG